MNSIQEALDFDDVAMEVRLKMRKLGYLDMQYIYRPMCLDTRIANWNLSGVFHSSPSVQWRMCRTTESSVFRPPCPWEVFVIPLKLSSPWVQYAKLASGSAPVGSNHGLTDSLKQKKQGKPERGILNRTYYGAVGDEQKKKTRHIFSYGQHGFTKR